MPITYTYDPKLNLVRSCVTGHTDTREGMDYNRELRDDRALRQGFVEICDFTGVEDYAFNHSNARELSEMFHELRRRGYRGTVFLVKTELQYGTTRMFKQISDTWGLPVEITRDPEAVITLAEKIRAIEPNHH